MASLFPPSVMVTVAPHCSSSAPSLSKLPRRCCRPSAGPIRGEHHSSAPITAHLVLVAVGEGHGLRPAEAPVGVVQVQADAGAAVGVGPVGPGSTEHM